jgi:hypothetical protein
MPLMFGGMSLFFPSGLTVYIFTNTTLGILHSLYMNRTTPKLVVKPLKPQPEAAPAEVRQAKRVVAEVSDTDDGDDDDDKPSRSSSKGGGGKKRGQRRGQRR